MAFLDRAFTQVRGALWGVVTVLGMTVLGMGTYIWNGHIAIEDAHRTEQAARDIKQDQEHERAVEKFKADAAAYQAYNAEKITERVKFESRALAIMERLDRDVEELRRKKR